MTASTHLSHPKYRSDIDGLRAVAILSVLAFHIFPDWMPGGFVGVDIFFVISGFLISTIIFENLEAGHFSYAEFYARRIKRIFPALVLTLFVSFALGWALMPAEYFRVAGKHLYSGAAFLVNFALLRETNYFNATGDTDPFHHLWSLAVEEQFYIFWPLMLGLVWKRRWNFLWITLAVACASFAFDVTTLASDAAVAFYSPLSRFWELMVGGVLAYLVLHKPQALSHMPRGTSLAGALLMVLGFVLISPQSDFPGWVSLFPTMGAFLLMAAGPQGWINRHVLGRKPMVWVGLISYPLYLWHWPLLVYARIYTAGDPALPGRLLVLVASMALAWATYRFVEKPVRWQLPGKPVVTALLVLLSGMLILGKATDRAEGFPAREANQQVFRFHYDAAAGYRSGLCFLDAPGPHFSAKDFKGNCAERSSPGVPLVFLWGDSFAASLYRGLLYQGKLQGFDLAQYTASGCPGIVGFDIDKRNSCREINAYIFDQVKLLRPHTVILGGNWALYDRRNSNWSELDFSKFERTISSLKALGVAHIVLVGQLPTFKIDQPIVASKVFVKDAVDRTMRSVNPQDYPVNERMRRFAAANGVDFLSPMDALCNPSGCLISASPHELKPLSFDYGHLTEDGSRMLIDEALRHHQITLP